MCACFIAGFPATPSALADDKGNEVSESEWEERKKREEGGKRRENSYTLHVHAGCCNQHSKFQMA